MHKCSRLNNAQPTFKSRLGDGIEFPPFCEG